MAVILSVDREWLQFIKTASSTKRGLLVLDAGVVRLKNLEEMTIHLCSRYDFENGAHIALLTIKNGKKCFLEHVQNEYS